MGLFDWLKRTPPQAPVWHVFRDGSDVVADDGRGGTFRVALVRAESVRIVPMTGGNPHAGAMGGYQVAVRGAHGDAPIGKPSRDWQSARELARQVCAVTELPLDELSERLFGQLDANVDA